MLVGDDPEVVPKRLLGSCLVTCRSEMGCGIFVGCSQAGHQCESQDCTNFAETTTHTQQLLGILPCPPRAALPEALLTSWRPAASIKPEKLTEAEGQRQPEKFLVVDSHPKHAPQPLWGSFQGFVSPSQVVGGCSVLRTLREVLTGEALPQGERWLDEVFLGHCEGWSQTRYWFKN